MDSTCAGRFLCAALANALQFLEIAVLSCST